MRTVALSALATVVAAASMQAQTYIELPGGGFTTQVDQTYDPYLCTRTSYQPLHIQYAYDTADVPSAGVIKSLAWHRNNYYSNAMPAGSITTTITMALSPNTPANMSSTFANNLVNVPMVVFTGTTNWPAIAKGTGPAPWTHTVMLTTPYPFAKAPGSLIVDLVTTASTGYTTSTYTIDASGPDNGTRRNNGNPPSTCKFSNGKYNSGLSYTTAGMNNNGGTWYVNYNSLLPNAPGTVLLSVNGINNPGPWPLPIDLTGLQMPGCFWHVGLNASDLWIPGLTANASGSARLPNLTIPPGLGGFSFYDHGVFIDTAANAAGLVTTWSSEWYIGTLKGPSANTLYRTADTSGSPTGFFRAGQGTHLRIEQ